MGIQNADDALRIVTNALDDIPPARMEIIRQEKIREANNNFFQGYFQKYPNLQIEIPPDPNMRIDNPDYHKFDTPEYLEYAAALEKDKQVKERILKDARKKAIEDAAAVAEKRFYELGYTDDLPNAQELIDNLHQEEILNTPFPYFSDKWNPVASQPQPVPQEVPGTTAPIPTNSGAIAPEVVSVLSTQPGMNVPQPRIFTKETQMFSIPAGEKDNWGKVSDGTSKYFNSRPDLPDGTVVEFYNEDFGAPMKGVYQDGAIKIFPVNGKQRPDQGAGAILLGKGGYIRELPGEQNPFLSQPEVVVTAPQYEGNSRIEDVPLSGVNNAVYPGSKAVGTSSDLPGGGNYDFEGEEFNRQNNYTFPGGTPNHPEIPGLNDPADPDANLKWLWERNQRESQAREQYLNNKAREEANTGNYWQNVWDGIKKGFQYSVDAGKHEGRTASAVWNRAPESQYAHLQPEGKAGFFGGRVAGEIGNGTRQVLWNLQPPDFVSTHGAKFLGEDATRMAKVVVPFAAVTGLELGSQIYNPFNLAEGGRVAGYQAINPDEDDPRISTTPLSELLIDRGFLGKRGKLLPWEQFRQERTDIPYEQYEKYQDYLRNKDENFLRDMTGGLIKGTLDGINGPELSVMGYSVTPTGALAAGAALLAGRELVRTGRIAGFRKQ